MAEWSNGFTGLVLVDLEPDIYTVTVTDNNDCVESASYTIDPGGTVDVTVLQIQDVSCHGGSNGTISVSASGGNEPYTYIWSNGMMGPSIIGLSPGSYLVTVTDANACTAVMSAAVSEPPLLTIAIAATDETSVGANDGTAAATAGGGIPSYNYLWSNDSTTATIAGLAPGTYTVTITDMNGCSVSGSGQVFAFGCTLDVMLSMDLSICEGDTIVIVPIVTGPSGGVSYLWTDGSTSDSIQVSQGGEYCVTLTDAAGCQDVDCIFVTVNIIPLLTCPVTNESVPDANDGAIQCDSLPGIVTYSWSNGATTSSITSLSPGEYCVTVTDVNGCTTSQCFNVQPANCQMTVTATQTDVSCNGDSTGSISLTVTGATEPVTYTWSNGGTSAAISNLSAGSYSVMVADSVGCFDNQSFLITEPPAIHIMVDSIAPVQDFDSGLIWITASGGIPPFSYQWIDPNGESFNSEDLNNLFSVGYYTVTVTDAAGCMVVVDSIFVDMDLAVDLQSHFKALKVYPVPTDDVLYIDIEIGITEVIISGADGRVYKHIINSGSNKIDVSDLGSGWYVIKISDGWQWYMGRMIKM
jgi:hypothetical protein